MHRFKREVKMTGWDILDRFIASFPPIAATILFATAAVIFIIGFTKHGFNFLKYGFKQMILDSTLEKRFDRLEEKIELIETNHFGHLKDFLTELTSILQDKDIINNAEKTRLDNHLRGM